MRLIEFFYCLRGHDIPATTAEFFDLLEMLRSPLASPSLDNFYTLGRLCLVKDARHYDRYDQAFSAFLGMHPLPERKNLKDIPLEWLLEDFKRSLTEEQKAAIEALGWDKLLELFKQRLAEQTERHAGGSKWIGTGGTSPFGHSGYNPAGIRVGGRSQHRSAVKVWEERRFAEYDDQKTLDIRNFQMALRRLRSYAREGRAEELDLDETLRSTAQQGGHLQLRFRPEKRNQAKVLMLLDTGGSMDDHISLVESLFSAAGSQFQHLEVYYFHNCVYERVWRYDSQGQRVNVATVELLRTYSSRWRLILVGDASMSPYEIVQPGGSVEHFNRESGEQWLQRLLAHWPKAVWLIPEVPEYWAYTYSIQMLREIMSERMYPVTLAGLSEAMRELN